PPRHLSSFPTRRSSDLILSAPTDARRHWRETFLLGLGFASPILLTVLYFAIHGALHDFIFYTWTYNTRYYVPEVPLANRFPTIRDRKSTRLNSSHQIIS